MALRKSLSEKKAGGGCPNGPPWKGRVTQMFLLTKKKIFFSPREYIQIHKSNRKHCETQLLEVAKAWKSQCQGNTVEKYCLRQWQFMSDTKSEKNGGSIQTFGWPSVCHVLCGYGHIACSSAMWHQWQGSGLEATFQGTTLVEHQASKVRPITASMHQCINASIHQSAWWLNHSQYSCGLISEDYETKHLPTAKKLRTSTGSCKASGKLRSTQA